MVPRWPHNIPHCFCMLDHTILFGDEVIMPYSLDKKLQYCFLRLPQVSHHQSFFQLPNLYLICNSFKHLVFCWVILCQWICGCTGPFRSYTQDQVLLCRVNNIVGQQPSGVSLWNITLSSKTLGTRTLWQGPVFYSHTVDCLADLDVFWHLKNVSWFVTPSNPVNYSFFYLQFP